MRVGGRVVVYGAGGHGKVVGDAARSAGFTLAGFVDDAPDRQRGLIWSLPVVSWHDFLRDRDRWAECALALGVGDNAARQLCHSRIGSVTVPVVTLVHASATIAPTAKLGAGTVVLAGAVVNPDATLGAGCIVNTGAVVEHDCVLGDYVHVSPNAALGGGVRVGDRSHLGLGAVALPLVAIGSDVTVGAGAVVHRPVPSGTTVVGIPARPLER